MSDTQPVGTPAEQSQHRDVPSPAEHNQNMHDTRPDECVGRPS